MADSDATRVQVANLLRGIDRYNPEHLTTLEAYVTAQAQEVTYDLEANLTILKLYQFNPSYYNQYSVGQILLKALTNLPHTDFVMCKCLIEPVHLEGNENPLQRILSYADLLETCQFEDFWRMLEQDANFIEAFQMNGFGDEIRKYVCHVVNITYQNIEKEELRELLGGVDTPSLHQWINRYGWRDNGDGSLFIQSQELNVKTKEIVEKISFENVAPVLASIK